jgi:hypothetical protein
MQINDKQKYNKEDPDAVHIQASAEDVVEVHALMSKRYSSKAETFPLGRRMRYVSIVHDISSMHGLTKYHLLRNRQDSRCAQHQAETVESLAVIDTAVGKTSKTLRKMIMKIPATAGNTETPLFMAINACSFERQRLHHFLSSGQRGRSIHHAQRIVLLSTGKVWRCYQ